MALPDGMTLEELAAKFSTFNPAEIISSDPNQTFEIGLPGGTFSYKSRSQLASQFIGTAPPVTSQFTDLLSRQLALPVPEPKSEEPGVFNIPILGTALDVLDFPRSALVSTIQEIGDMFGSGDASLSDWWTQTATNMSAGEVLRNWGVDLPGPLDFIAGFGLDVALDPLTYLAGAGLALRAIKGAPEVASALIRVADAADAAGDVAKANRFRQAEQLVSTRGVLAGAGKHVDEFLEIGINPNLGFIVPGTGVIGRRVIARPLSSISPRFKEFYTAAQVRQTPQLVVDAARTGKRKFDILNPNNQQLVINNMLGRGGFATKQKAVGEVAEIVSKTAIKVDLPGPLGVGGAKAIGALAGSVGGTWNAVARRSFIEGINRSINSQYSINRALRDVDPNVRRLARNVRHYGQQANISAGRWEKQTLDELASIVRSSGRLQLSPEDFDELMFVVATTPQAQFVEAGLGKWAAAADGGSDELHELAMEAQSWWQSAGRRANEASPSININWQESLYAARMRDDIQAGRRVYNAEEGINVSAIDQLSGSPEVARRLLEPKIIRQRILNARRQPSRRLPFSDEATRLERQARITVDSASDADIEAEFLRLLDAELEQGVRYVDGDSVMTNKYLDEVIVDSDNSKSVLAQMKDIDSRIGVATEVRKGKPFSFSSDAKSVLPRYVALMKGNIRTRNVIDKAMEDGVLVPGSTIKQGAAARQVIQAAEGVRYNEQRLTEAMRQLEDLGATDEQIADVLEDMLLNRGITPDQVRQFVQTPEGELYAPIAALEAELDTLIEVLTASNRGVFFDSLDPNAPKLSEEARNLLLGGEEVDNWAGLSARKREQIARNRANRDEALLAVQEATDYVYRVTQILGGLEARRNALGAVLKQMRNQRPEMPATTAQRLDRLARDLDESRALITDLVENIKAAYATSDATVIAALGLRQFGATASVKAARDELRSTARLMGRTAEGLRQLREMISYIPENGEYVRFVRDGRTKSWDVRVRKQPLKKRPRNPRDDTLAAILGAERAEGVRKIAATLDDSPESLAQIKILENYVNITLLQEKLGKLVPGSETLNAIDSALGDAIAVREVVAAAAHNQYWDTLTAALDGAVAAGRRSPSMKEVLDPLAERAAEIQGVLDRTVAKIESIASTVRDATARRELYQAELIVSTAEVQRLAEGAWIPGKLSAAVDADEAAKIVLDAQGLNALSDVFSQALPEHIMSRMKSYAPGFRTDLNTPTVGSLTESKLRGTSFVAPLQGELADEDIVNLAREFAEMFQSAARTFDPQEMAGFFKMMERFNNWWKAQAVGTPGFVMRNMMGAMWMNNQLAGVPFETMGRVVLIRRKAAAIAKDAQREGDIIYGLNQMIESGGSKIRGSIFSGSSGVSVEELRTFVDWYSSGLASGTGGRGIDIVTGVDTGGAVVEAKGFLSGVEAGTWKPTADFKLFAGIRGWNADVEFMARGSLAHHVMMRNGTVEEASTLVTKYHFDYSDLTATERALKQVIPFWTWQRRVLPVLVESIGRNPKAWNRISQFTANVERQSPEEGVVPAYFGENMGIRLPFTSNGFRSYMLPDLPFTDLAEWAKGFDPQSEGKESLDATDIPMALLRKPLESAIPSYKLPIELFMETRSFNQVPLRDELEPAPSWSKIPMIRDALKLSGLAQTSKSGELFMSDTDKYKVEQFVPFFARVSRLLPESDPMWETSDNAKQTSAILSTLFGLGIRVNTPKEKRNQIMRDMYQRNSEQNRLRALSR